MTQETLGRVIESHRTWLDTGGTEGKVADLSSHDLRRLDFENADLRMAIFRNADLSGADLMGADLTHAQLSESNLRGAVLRKTDLTGANLQNAQLYDADLYGSKLHEVDLTTVHGLVQCQLSGTDLSNAQLPADAGKFVSLEHVTDISVQARSLLWVTVGACFLAAVTMFVTTDGAIVAQSGSTLLPVVVNINVPIHAFFWLIPLILLSLYLYLHFQLQYLWDGLASLPSVFPDGISLEEKAYPLFLVGLVRQYVPILEKNRPPLSWLRVAASIASAWGLVPFTIFLCWLRYLRVHDIWGTAWHIGLLTLAIWFGMATYCLTAETLKGEKHPQPGGGGHRQGYQLVARNRIVIVSVAAVLISLCYITVAVLYPGWIGKDEAWINQDVKDEMTSLRKWFCPDLSYSDISHKPDDWYRLTDADRENLVGVKGALLTGVNLRGANGTGAFLAKATLTEADLQGANFSEADLRKSSLNKAKLRNAQLEHAKLSGAHLDGADLRGAKLKSAKMLDVHLSEAWLNDANLYGAQLQNAILEGAHLEKADLGEAHLQGANLKGAEMPGASLWKAELNGAVLNGAQLQKAILEEANFEGANLAGAKLQGANVRSAGFGKAWFQETELQGVDLSQAKDLTREQLEGACGDKDTKLPPGFERIKDCGTRN
jgi:uncharacterized protein YjbI with pentapeptide repeats